MTSCKPQDTYSTTDLPPPTAQNSPSGLTDICQTSPSVITAPSHHQLQVGVLATCVGVVSLFASVQTLSYQTTPHDSLHQSVRPHPYGWSHSDHSAMYSGVREKGQPQALSDMTGPAQTTMLKTIFVQNIGWAVQVCTMYNEGTLRVWHVHELHHNI